MQWASPVLIVTLSDNSYHRMILLSAHEDPGITTLVDIPHGVRYSLTLHEPYGGRILGYDNAHAVKPPGKFKYAGTRLPYDHRHRHVSDKGVPYAFRDAYQLLSDFFTEVDRVLQEIRGS